jgi:lysophospholipase L1-like esterase
MARWVARLAILFTATLGAVAFVATPADAADPVDFVALGDSYSSGTGAPPYQNAGCLRSSRSYAPLWASSHPVTSFAFPACGGATTSDVLGSQLGSLNANTDLVTITIGGNDIGFADVMTTCTLGSNTSCVNAVNGATSEANTLLPARLDATYAAIRAAAPNALVIVLGYPRLISPTGSCGLFNLSTTKRTALNNGADMLDAVIAGRVAAAGPGFVYQSAIGPFTGHGACGSSPWINRFSLFQIAESYHPNATGYSAGYLALVNAVTG